MHLYTNHQLSAISYTNGKKSHIVALFTEKDSYTNLQKNNNNNKKMREAKATISNQSSALLLLVSPHLQVMVYFTNFST